MSYSTGTMFHVRFRRKKIFPPILGKSQTVRTTDAFIGVGVGLPCRPLSTTRTAETYAFVILLLEQTSTEIALLYSDHLKEICTVIFELVSREFLEIGTAVLAAAVVSNLISVYAQHPLLISSPARERNCSKIATYRIPSQPRPGFYKCRIARKRILWSYSSKFL